MEYSASLWRGRVATERNNIENKEGQSILKMNGELSDSFDIGVGVRQGCVMSPWLFSVFMDGCMREMKVKVENIGARLKLYECDWTVVVSLFADNTVLLADSERKLQEVVDEFYKVCV